MIDPAEIAPDDLPRSLQWMIDAIGLDDTLAIVELHGGGRVWVSPRFRSGDPLVSRIGLPACQRLAAAWLATGLPSRSVDVPSMARARKAVRDRNIRERSRQRCSQPNIAVEFDISLRTVRRVCAGMGDT